MSTSYSRDSYHHLLQVAGCNGNRHDSSQDFRSFCLKESEFAFLEEDSLISNYRWDSSRSRTNQTNWIRRQINFQTKKYFPNFKIENESSSCTVWDFGIPNYPALVLENLVWTAKWLSLQWIFGWNFQFGSSKLEPDNGVSGDQTKAKSIHKCYLKVLASFFWKIERLKHHHELFPLRFIREPHFDKQAPIQSGRIQRFLLEP